MTCFEKEKEFYKTNIYSNIPGWSLTFDQNRINPLGGFDPDIFPFLALVNTFPFMYTAGMSCSGSLKDHSNELPKRNARYGTNISDYQGFCVIRANISDERWVSIQDLLLSVNHSQLTSSKDWESQDHADYKRFPVTEKRKLFAYQIFTGEGKVSGKEITDVWRDLTLGLVKLIQDSNKTDFYDY